MIYDIKYELYLVYIECIWLFLLQNQYKFWKFYTNESLLVMWCSIFFKGFSQHPIKIKGL